MFGWEVDAWSRFWRWIWSRFVFELVKLLQEVTLERWTQQITQINFKHQHINCTNLKWNDYRHKFNLWKRHFLWFFPSCCISQGCRKGVAKVIFFHHCDFKSVPMLYTGLANSKFSCTNQILRHVEFQICITLPHRRASEACRTQNSFIPPFSGLWPPAWLLKSGGEPVYAESRSRSVYAKL